VRVTERPHHAVLCAKQEAGPPWRHVRHTGRNVPFDPLCGARPFVPGKGAASTDTLETGSTRQSGMTHHANTTPSASGNPTAALEAAAVRLRAHHRGPGRRGGLGYPAAPARTAAPGTWYCAVDVANQASPDVRVDHHHHHHHHYHCSPGADHRASAIDYCEPWAASRQRTDHDRPIGSGPSAGHGRRQDTNHGALDRCRHHPAHRDRATTHGRAHHHRANQHGSVDDHAGVHDQHCTHDRAHDQRRADHDLDRAGDDHDWADHDRGGNDDDRAGGPVREPTSRRLGRGCRCAPAHPGSAVPAARAGSPRRWDPRQAAPRQPPPPPRLIRPGARPASNPKVAFLELGTAAMAVDRPPKSQAPSGPATQACEARDE
jgi:hypothetical protein